MPYIEDLLVDFIEAVFLALLQGLTEFLPISSSAHLILVPVITDWPDQGLAFDVAVHVGTLLAVSLYYRKDLLHIGRDWAGSIMGQPASEYSRLGWLIIIATIPVGLVGIALTQSVELALRSPLVIAGATIVFALLLWWSQQQAAADRAPGSVWWRDALVIGCFQVLALIPGTSRSGITMTGALMLGFDKEFAARFSFLMSVPVIALAGGVKTLDLLQGNEVVAWDLLLLGVVVSAIVAYLTIEWFLWLLGRLGFMPFVIYRLLLGTVLLAVFI